MINQLRALKLFGKRHTLNSGQTGGDFVGSQSDDGRGGAMG